MCCWESQARLSMGDGLARAVFPMCHWKGIDGGVALLYPVVASPTSPGWPSQGVCVLLVLCRGMETTPFKVL